MLGRLDILIAALRSRTTPRPVSPRSAAFPSRTVTNAAPSTTAPVASAAAAAAVYSPPAARSVAPSGRPPVEPQSRSAAPASPAATANSAGSSSSTSAAATAAKAQVSTGMVRALTLAPGQRPPDNPAPDGTVWMWVPGHIQPVAVPLSQIGM